MMFIQEGDSALMVAARWGKTGVVEKLIEAGADLILVCQYCTINQITQLEVDNLISA